MSGDFIFEKFLKMNMCLIKLLSMIEALHSIINLLKGILIMPVVM